MKLIATLAFAGMVCLADLPESSSSRNFYRPHPTQPQSVFVITDVSQVKFPKNYVGRKLTWEKSDDGAAYNIYVKIGGAIQYIYITPSPSQLIYLPRSGSAEVWVTAFSSSHIESSPSRVIRVRNGVTDNRFPLDNNRFPLR